MMPQPLWNIIGSQALNLLLQSTAILAIGTIVASLVRRHSATMQSLVLRTMLVAVMVCPVVSVVLTRVGVMGLRVNLPVALAEVAESQSDVGRALPAEDRASVEDTAGADAADGINVNATSSPPHESGSSLDARPPSTALRAGRREPMPMNDASRAPVNTENATPNAAGAPSQITFAPPQPTIEPIPQAAPKRPLARVLCLLSLGMWLTISALLLTRLTLAIRLLRRVRRAAKSASYQWIEDAGRCARVMGVPTPPILATQHFKTPCLVGCQHPAILLPTEATSVRFDVLMHELAHLRRNDCRWHLLTHVVTAILWCQPLMWVLSRRLERAADDVCDDFVIAYGSNRAEYAHALVDLAEKHQPTWVGTGCAVGMAGFRSSVGKRVVRIMDNTRRISLGSRKLTALMVLLLCAAGTFLAAMLGTNVPIASADAPTQPTAARAPVPDAPSVAKKEKLVRDVFGNYGSAPATERSAIAGKMIDQAAASGDDVVARYVLLKDAADLAAGVGDAPTAMRAASLLAASYAIDGGEFKYSLLKKCATVAVGLPTHPAQSVADEGLIVVNEAVAAGNLDLANRLMTATEQAARNAKNPALLQAVQQRITEIRWMQIEAMRAKSAQEKLAKSPDDPDANLTLGRYFCFVKGDWNGLQGLAKGSHPGFKAAATADLANPTTTDKQVGVGDLWWDLSEKEKDMAQKAMKRRAGYWYAQAATSPQLAGLTRALVEKRLAQVPAAPGDIVASSPAQTPPAAPPTPATPEQPHPPENVSQRGLFPAGANGAGRRLNVLVFGKTKEQALFASVGGNMHLVQFADTAKVLADPQAFNQSNIIVWGANTLVAAGEDALTPAAWDNMNRFMHAGGDLVIFEQSSGNTAAAERFKKNWAFIETNFGVRVHGSAIYPLKATDPALAARLSKGGLGEDYMSKARFYNAYTLPENASVLLRAGKNYDKPVAAGIPVGKGRLVLIGTGVETTDELLDKAILEYVYRDIPMGKGTAQAPPVSSGIPAAGNTRGKNILLFIGDRKEEAIFRAIPGANVRVIESRDTPAVLANPQAFNGANIVVWGRNELIGVKEDVLTNAVWDRIRAVVESGGDLVIFEQGPGNADLAAHLKANWTYIEKNFGVTYQGGPMNHAQIADPALAAMCATAGLGPDYLDKVSFCDGYRLPATASVLVRGGNKFEWPVMAGVPVGKGRLILCGTNLNPTDQALSKLLFEYIYSSPSRPQSAATDGLVTNSIGMKFVLIPLGAFSMGSPTGEKGRRDDETQHKVTLTKALYMQTTPVTNAQWKAVMGNEAAHFHGDNVPVEYVDWNDAVDFCRKLSEKDGRRYRLPTEAEWEYACRAGTTSAAYSPNDPAELGWYNAISGNKTHPVAQKLPNSWGLYDMYGNVRQWCGDYYGPYSGDAVDPAGPQTGDKDSNRVLRGGTWPLGADQFRSAIRSKNVPQTRSSDVGFRVCMDSTGASTTGATAPGSGTDLTTIQPSASQVGFARLGVNEVPSFVDHLPKINGQPATRYFFAHAPSRITFAAGTFAGKTFSAKGIVTHPATHGVIFAVQVNGTEIFRSKLAKHDEVIDIQAKLPVDARTLDLVVDPDGVSTSAWAFWTYPVIDGDAGVKASTGAAPPAGAAGSVSSDAANALTAKLNDPSHWIVKKGTWQNVAGKIRGEGDSEIWCDAPLPRDVALSFNMNVLQGSDPRMDFYPTDVRLNNLGAGQNLFPVLGPGAKLTTPPDGYIGGTRVGVPFTNNQPKVMTFKFSQDHFAVEVDGKPVYGGTYAPGPDIRLQFHGGGKNGGITEYSGFKVEPLSGAATGIGGSIFGDTGAAPAKK